MITTEQLKPECKEELRNDFKASLMKDRSRREEEGFCISAFKGFCVWEALSDEA